MTQRKHKCAFPAPKAEAVVDPLEEVFGPSIWESAGHNKVPASAWEYHIRRQNNDAAYSNLEYVPYCSTMPVQRRCEEPKFMWKKKERH